MAVKKSARVPKKRQHSHTGKIVKAPAPPIKTIKKRKALVIAQEIKFARLLANNDKRVRDKMLKNLKKWLTVRSESSFAFTEADFMRLWKGLFYCMWMSDKPLIQEELAESLSNIVHCFDSMATALLYTKCTFKTLATEWFGIDQYRLDKFQMLARRILRQTFEMCRRKSWDEEWTNGTARVIEDILLDPKTSLGFSLHITEIYMEEMAKIGDGSIPPNLVTELLRPFAVHLAAMQDERQIRHVMKHIFRYLMFQSDVGMDYMEKFEAWRQAGFPTGNINAMEKVEISDEEDDDDDVDNSDNDDSDFEIDEDDDGEDDDDDDDDYDDDDDDLKTEMKEAEEAEEEESDEEKLVPNGPTALDPRAGRVDVLLPQLPFDPLEIAKLIKHYKFHPKSTAKTRRQIVRLTSEFSQLAKGEMPLGVKEVDVPVRKSGETNPKKAAYRLQKFEKDLYSDTVHRKRKRKQADPPVEDDEGFENLLTPIDQAEHEADESDDEDAALELENDEETTDSVEPRNTDTTAHISQNENKKKRKKSAPEVNTAVLPKKASQKNQKKQKTQEKQSVVSEDNKATEKEQPEPTKKMKIKEKKSKTKKFLKAVSSLNQKLLKRSSDEVTTKAKKARLGNDNAWNVSNSNDSSTAAGSSKVKTAKTSSVKVAAETKTTLEINGQAISNSPTKEQLSKIPWLHPVLTKLEDCKKPQTPTKSNPEPAQCGSSGKKRVKIMLRRNTAQHTSEYIRQLRQNPAIPYDGSRKPPAGVLKSTPLSSPVNPFYKRT